MADSTLDALDRAIALADDVLADPDLPSADRSDAERIRDLLLESRSITEQAVALLEEK